MATVEHPIYKERWTPAGPIRSPLSPEVIETEEARAAVSVGDAAPLGLLGFASATFTLSWINAGWFPASTLSEAVPIALIFGGIAQFIAAMWSYRKGDTFAATAFGSFGSFNVMFSLIMLFRQSSLIPTTIKPTAVGVQAVMAGSELGVIGMATACFGLIAFMLMFAALWRNMALVSVLFFLGCTYGLLGAGLMANGAHSLIVLAGWAGIASSLLAFYTAGAMVINSVSERELLPLGASRTTPPVVPVRVAST